MLAPILELWQGTGYPSEGREEMTWYEGFDIGEFEKQEDQMIELACYIFQQEIQDCTQTFDQVNEVANRYQGYVTYHQLNYATLLFHGQRSYAFDPFATKGSEHYQRLFH